MGPAQSRVRAFEVVDAKTLQILTTALPLGAESSSERHRRWRYCFQAKATVAQDAWRSDPTARVALQAAMTRDHRSLSMAGHAHELEHTLAAIEEIIRTSAAPPLRAEDMRSPDERLVLLENVRSDLRLAARALRHLHSALVELRDAHRVMFDPCSSERDRLRVFETSHDTGLDLELSIREVYELSYAVQELVMMAPVEERPPARVTSDLAELKVFRGELLVHKARVARFMRGGRIGTPEELDLRIGVAIQPISDQDASQLNAIFARAAPNLPPELRAEVNWNERLQHLAENPDCVLPPDRGELRRLIARNGIKSASPLKLARVILRLVEHYFGPNAS